MYFFPFFIPLINYRIEGKILIRLQVHFRGYPGTVLIPCEGEDSVKWSYVNSLKEVSTGVLQFDNTAFLGNLLLLILKRLKVLLGTMYV